MGVGIIFVANQNNIIFLWFCKHLLTMIFQLILRHHLYVENNREAITPRQMIMQAQEELVRRRCVHLSNNGNRRGFSVEQSGVLSLVTHPQTMDFLPR